MEYKQCIECKQFLEINKFKKCYKGDKQYWTKACQKCLNLKLKEYRRIFYINKLKENPFYNKKYKQKYRESE